MNKPKRIQRKRTKGWRMPPNTVYVGRPSKWKNPWISSNYTATEAFRHYWPEKFPGLVKEAKKELKGKNLACWCKLSEPCHADVLLEIANKDRKATSK